MVLQLSFHRPRDYAANDSTIFCCDYIGCWASCMPIEVIK